MRTRLLYVIYLLVYCSCFAVGCSSLPLHEYYQNLTVTTEPPGATVQVGIQTRESPATFKVIVTRNSHRKRFIQISKDGYMPSHPRLKQTASSIHVELVKLEEAKNKRVEVIFKKLAVIPNIVPPGSPFGFRVEYNVFDNTIIDKEVPIELGFTIMGGKKELYKDSTNLLVPRGKFYLTEKLNLRSGPIPGEYKFQVWIKYKDKENRIATKLDVR